MLTWKRCPKYIIKWKIKGRFHNKLCNRFFVLKYLHILIEKSGRVVKMKGHINPFFLHHQALVMLNGCEVSKS